MSRALVVLICLSFYSYNTFGSSEGISTFSFRPTIDNSSYFTVYDGSHLEPGRFVFGLSQTFAYKVLSVERLNAPTDPLVAKAALLHVSLAVGVFRDWLTLGLEMPVGMHEVGDLEVLGTSTDNRFVLGDPLLVSKIRLFRSSEETLRIHALPFMTIPADFGREFAGSSRPTGGLKLAFDLKLHERISLGWNVGANFRKAFQIGNQRNRHQLLTGLGVASRFHEYLSLVGEANGQIDMRSPFDAGRESLLEFLFGLKGDFEAYNSSVFLLGGAGSSSQNGVPKWRLASGWKLGF